MSEYSYEIDKYIVGVDNNGEDGIGLTIATMKDNELHILGSCYGDNARFIDSLIKENQSLKKENEILRENAKHNDKVVDNVNWENMLLKKENSQLKDKLSKIETLIINHNCDTGDIYYKYNSKFLKSELKQRILEIVYKEGSDNNGI